MTEQEREQRRAWVTALQERADAVVALEAMTKQIRAMRTPQMLAYIDDESADVQREIAAIAFESGLSIPSLTELN